MPLANYLTNTKSPLTIDWVFNAEVNNDNTDVLNILSTKRTFIFMEKEPQLIKISNIPEKFHSSLSYFITLNWAKIDSTKYFDVYKIKTPNLSTNN
jgi:hypothetical protein